MLLLFSWSNLSVRKSVIQPTSFEFKDKILQAWFSLTQGQCYAIQVMFRCPEVCLNIIYIICVASCHSQSGVKGITCQTESGHLTEWLSLTVTEFVIHGV